MCMLHDSECVCGVCVCAVSLILLLCNGRRSSSTSWFARFFTEEGCHHLRHTQLVSGSRRESIRKGRSPQEI